MEQKTVKIGQRLVGEGQPCFIIAEIGINHNGDVGIAKRLIDVAKDAGCDAVKFQKRTPELCVPLAQRDQMRDTPWGYISYLEYRKKIELGWDDYKELTRYCHETAEIRMFSSVWDSTSACDAALLGQPCTKIASACLTNDELLKKVRALDVAVLGRVWKPVILSTGMSTLEQIDHAVDVLGTEHLILLHTVSTYPAMYEELNLRAIHTLKERYQVPVGYSGHETGIATSVAAVAMGACVVERHITLDRAMWGSDHAASLEPQGLHRLVRDIRLVESAMGTGEKKVLERELPILARLRG